MNEPISSPRPLVVGTRGSALARWQTEFVIAALEKIAPTREIEMRVITTSGDRDQRRPLADFGALGVFTSELENALRAGEIDIAVHSLKDIPTDPTDDLVLAALPERADARDVLVSRHGVGLMQLPSNPRVGTSSARRTAQLRALRPDVQIISLRGNVETRLEKAMSEEYDAIVLAAAGLVRLGHSSAITAYFSVDDMMPDPGQGALAVQIRADDADAYALVARLDHAPTRQAVSAERAFLRALGGGCRTPMAAFAEQRDEFLVLRGMVALSDGDKLMRGEKAGKPDHPEVLGIALAAQMRGHAGDRGLPVLASTNAPHRHSLHGKRIVITRAATQAKKLADQIRACGGEPVLFPTIALAQLDDFRELDAQLTHIERFDWVVFTSANGVWAVAERLHTLRLNFTVLANARIAAIGTGTAEALARQGVGVDFIPSQFLGAQIARELPAAPKTTVLLLRADLASDELAQGLTTRGIAVTDVDAYRTVKTAPTPLNWNSVDAVTFTSASTVKHCWELLDESARGELARCDIFCIGPVTAAAVQDVGLAVTATATTHTLEGLVAALNDYYEREIHAA